MAMMAGVATAAAMATGFALSKDTLLVEAAESGNVRTLERLLRDGADIEQRDWRGRTALLAATHGNRFEAARALVEAGADVNAKDAIDDSPYLYAGAHGHLEILVLLLAHVANLLFR